MPDMPPRPVQQYRRWRSGHRFYWLQQPLSQEICQCEWWTGCIRLHQLPIDKDMSKGWNWFAHTALRVVSVQKEVLLV